MREVAGMGGRQATAGPDHLREVEALDMLPCQDETHADAKARVGSDETDPDPVALLRKAALGHDGMVRGVARYLLPRCRGAATFAPSCHHTEP